MGYEQHSYYCYYKTSLVNQKKPRISIMPYMEVTHRIEMVEKKLGCFIPSWSIIVGEQSEMKSFQTLQSFLNVLITNHAIASFT